MNDWSCIALSPLACATQFIYLQLALKAMPKGKQQHDKPVRVPLPHPFYSAEGTDICLIVKDHKGEGHKAAKAMVAATEGHAGINKVGLGALAG
jgi:ribosome biogenesis protein UTP30